MNKSNGIVMSEIMKLKSGLKDKESENEEKDETPFIKKKLTKMVFGSKAKIPPPKFCPASERCGLDRLTNDQAEPEMEDPEVVAARQEQEKRRKDKHRRMEADRERMRQAIRDKYHLKKKEEPREQDIAGRIAGNRKTPEQVAMESMHDEEDEGIMTTLNDTYEKAKSTVVSACTSVANAVNLWRS